MTGTRRTPGTPRVATLEEVYANPQRIQHLELSLSRAGTQSSARRLGPRPYTDVKTIGGDIRTLVSAFEVGTHLQLTPGTQPNVYHVHESWRAVGLHLAVRVRPPGTWAAREGRFHLQNTNYAPVKRGSMMLIPATLLWGAPARRRSGMRSGPTRTNVPVSYGAVILIALSELVFPAIPGCGSCHSLADVFVTVVKL
jgi:hypothetical protein